MRKSHFQIDCTQLAALFLLATVCVTSYADNEFGVEALAGHIVLDDTNEQELIISNLDMANTEEERTLNTGELRPAVKLDWKHKTVPYQTEVQAAAQATQLDPALIHAVIATESGYNPRALSRKGAYGLMQVLPTTAQTMTPVPVSQWSARQQIYWGAHYLKRMLDMFEGNVTLALAAYNAGPQAVKKYQHAVPPFAETRQYVPKVLGYYQTFKSRLSLANDVTH